MAATKRVEKGYQLAKERYAEMGVDTEKAMKRLAGIPISLHCWQGDDVGGFEQSEGLSKGGVMATGNYPGKARNPEELRSDLEKTYSLLPSRHRLALHGNYAETGGRRVERDELLPKHFANWIDWAKAIKIGLDFNSTYFSHPKSESGFTLSHQDEGIRKFWVRHAIACRRIGAAMGRALKSPCVTNIWIPDGFKDVPADRKAPRERLRKSLDEALAEKINPKHNLDAVEGKLFGLGSESYVVGSYDFYLAYAAKGNILLTLDTGHFHPTETVSDKISSVLCSLDGILLHVSRGIRWDSDHVVILSDELRAIAEEIIRGGYEKRVHIGLDFFDASINRVAAWTIGARCMIKALLIALLEPGEMLRRFEREGDFTSRLAMLEEIKTLPFGAVWDYYCERQGVPAGPAWLDEVRAYEKKVLFKRG